VENVTDLIIRLLKYINKILIKILINFWGLIFFLRLFIMYRKLLLNFRRRKI